jgi:hypothetical protein
MAISGIRAAQSRGKRKRAKDMGRIRVQIDGSFGRRVDKIMLWMTATHKGIIFLAQIYGIHILIQSNIDKREGLAHRIIPLKVTNFYSETCPNAQKTSRLWLSRLSKFDCNVVRARRTKASEVNTKLVPPRTLSAPKYQV